MSQRNFNELLQKLADAGRFVCVGLDTDIAKLPNSPVLAGLEPEEARLAFNKSIIDATKDIVGAYKPNSAFYEAEGPDGIKTLAATIAYINEVAGDIPVILDAKRADIGNTNQGYVKFAFDYLNADAITLHPYLGREALAPFLDRADKGSIIMCRNSNPGAGEFQDLEIDGGYLYEKVARSIVQWNENDNCSVVVGATVPDELRRVRSIIGDMPILIPGVGAQGGEATPTVRAGKNSKDQGMIINSSRGVIYASSGEDFAEAAGRAAVDLHEQIVTSLA